MNNVKLYDPRLTPITVTEILQFEMLGLTGSWRVCNLCNAKYKPTTATSNLTYHLKNAHQLLESQEPDDNV